MKKILILSSVLMSSMAMYSQEVSNNESPDVPELLSEQKVSSTFYGAKASPKANNPCKGATIRVCGVVTSELVALNPNTTSVYTEVKDASGTSLSTSTYLIEKPINEALEDIKINLLNEGGVIESDTEE
jgi:hypothetical protein